MTRSAWVADRFTASVAPAPERVRSPRQAVALYVSGIFVETLGLAVIAAYGWWVAGTVMAVAGVWIGAVGNRAWPVTESRVTVAQQLLGYLRAPRHRQDAGSQSNNPQR
jgi:hypothetical protein